MPDNGKPRPSEGRRGSAVLHKMREERKRGKGRKEKGGEDDGEAIGGPLGGHRGHWTDQNSLAAAMSSKQGQSPYFIIFFKKHRGKASLCIVFLKVHEQTGALPLFRDYGSYELF